MNKTLKIILLWIAVTMVLVVLASNAGYPELGGLMTMGSVGLAMYVVYQKGKVVITTQNGVNIYNNDFICTECGNAGKAALKLGGSAWAEVIAWIVSFALIMVTFGLSLLIGAAYTSSRRSNETKVCKACKGKVIPVSSPEGQLMMKKYGLIE